MNIIRISALQTNYIWFLYNNNRECIIVDPGEIKKILQILKKYKFILKAILLTHNHSDHTDGVRTLIQYYPNTIVFGPFETKNQGTNIIVSEGNNFTLLQKKFKVLHLPGHTSGHIGFYCPPWLFCGDTMFSAGCGKFDTKFAQQMYDSFIKISKLPRATIIFSGHEYTLSNINFAASILPMDKSIVNYYHKILKSSKNNQPTIPTTLNLELKINIFLRCNDINIKKSLYLFPKYEEEWKIFSKLRKKKDLFKLKNINI